MASVRSGNMSGRPRENGAASRIGAYGESSKQELPPALSRRARKEAQTSQPGTDAPPQAKGASRIPQTTSSRRPSLPTQHGRPSLAHQGKAWGSTSSSVPARAPAHSQTPSLSSSGRSTEFPPNQPRNVLRRKPSNLAEAGNIREKSRNGSSSSSASSIPRAPNFFGTSSTWPQDRGMTESPAEIRIAEKIELPVTTAQTVTIYPELDRYRNVKPTHPSDAVNAEIPYPIATHDLPPPTPLFSGTSSQLSGMSGSPSTRFSESPGPGPYSRDTTPTSMSSQSPGLMAPARNAAPRVRQIILAQTRPPVTRRRAGSLSNDVDVMVGDPQGLAAVRESLNSSSSNSTVRDADRKETKNKKKRLSPPPPSPPPRKSSQKFRKERQQDERPSQKPVDVQLPATRPSLSPTKLKAEGRTRPAASPRAPMPPSRPSRDGISDLQGLGLPLPVIQSNLSSTSLTEKIPSTEMSSSSQDRLLLPPSLSGVPQSHSRVPLAREATPAPQLATAKERKQTSNQEPGRTTRTPSPSVSTFKTRFPLFGRRTKTEVTAVDKTEKPARKGPAAGTGHEGYGRVGTVRRRSGSASNAPRVIPGTMSSQESLLSTQSHDAFLADRMAPVIIAGGEVVENRNTSSELARSESNQSLPIGRPSVESKNSSQGSPLPSEAQRDTLWPSPFPRGTTKGPSLGSRRPSDSSDSEAMAMNSTLAFRRSMQRLKQPDQQPLRLPKPIMVHPPGAGLSPSLNSLDTSVISDDSAMDPRKDSNRGRKDTTSSGPKKLTKRTRSPRKWNFFGRSQSQPASKKKSDATTVAATVQVVQAKPVAFYTLMDSSDQEDADMPDVQEVLREAQLLEVSSPQSNSSRLYSERERQPSDVRPPTRGEIGDFVATPSPRPDQRDPEPPVHTPEPDSTASGVVTAQTNGVLRPMGRPSRLPQVGRIPKVISARPEQTSPKSFSRPFNRISIQAPPRIETFDRYSIAKGPSPTIPATPELTQEGSTITGGTETSDRHSGVPKQTTEVERIVNEFLAFSPRKHSQDTSGTTSSSSGAISFADATAVIPAPGAPLVEDEIWDEYNDLLGEENMRVPPSAGSSQGIPFHLEGYEKRLAIEVGPVLESPTIAHRPSRSFDETRQAKKVPVLAISKVTEAFDISPPLATPFSMSDFVSGYGDRNNSVDSVALQDQPQQRNSSSSSTSSRRPRRSTVSSCSQVSEDSSPLSQVNLRVGSMTVSKWLTFGHVLFSPVRDELMPVDGSLKRQSILVVDGLGNDDWSFYAAETYPAANFFNLSPRTPIPVDRQSPSSFPLSPPNHHQIQYLSCAEKFPFGPQSFACVVYRFPIAAPESHYRNVIAEARRVLKPGGYLEMSILDVDLNNMGNRSRRAVRRLKERVHARAPDISLGSTSDLILRLLNSRFTDIKNCRVGIPVATPIASTAGAPESASPSTRGLSEKSKGKQKAKKDQRSLAEMMSDEGATADESITNMVAKVGRWWYSRCYESAAVSMGPGSGSMWSERSLLAECEEWHTSLNLMVCLARAPDRRSRNASI